MVFLLDSLREKFSQEEVEGFPDMNYRVGNTSGMDVARDVPSPLDQRIGRMAQLGGSMMEVEVDNPATFQIDRPELINTIERLGLDITLHGDPNVGFTSAYATGSQTAGFNIVHRYFKRYLEQVASFKEEVEERKQRSEIDFDIGYINMHASNEPLPRISQRRAADKSIGPFGKPVDEVSDGYGIYKNKEFLGLMFDFFLKEEIRGMSQLYQQFFSKASEEFDEKWREARSEAATNELATRLNEINDDYERAETLVNVLKGALRADQGIDTAYRDKLKNEDYSFSPVTIEVRQGMGLMDQSETVEKEVSSLRELSEAKKGNFLRSPAQLSKHLYALREDPNISVEEFEDIAEALTALVMEVWTEEASVSAKISALANTLDIQQREIMDKAEKNIEETARETFRGNEDLINSETHEELLNNILNALNQVNSEASIFFQIIPAWMMTSDFEGEDHLGWEAPKFIWNSIVGQHFDSYSELRKFVEEDRENELNVIAAVGACYIWGHFTQNRDKFDIDVFKKTTQTVEKQEFTWIEWMNKFDLKVNLEAMFGDPRQLKRVWRPKDIAVTCHAINMTAGSQSQEWKEDYKGPLVKFTIDMEHTASYGVDPVREIEELVRQEKKIAEEVDSVNSEKPLADIVKTYHLTKPGFESRQKSHRHGSFAKGDTTLYRWLYKLVENGFARNEVDPAIVMFEVGGEYEEDIYTIKVALNMIELGIKPEDVDASRVDPGEDYESKEEALLARFFGMDKPNYNREWSKIEEHAFDPLKGLLEAQDFDYTHSSSAAMSNNNRPGEWNQEEYK